jgi:glutathione S-transferase
VCPTRSCSSTQKRTSRKHPSTWRNSRSGRYPASCAPPLPPLQRSRSPSKKKKKQDDDGFILYESRAIGRYLAAKAHSPLYPHDTPTALARFEQAAATESENFASFAMEIYRERLVAPARGGTTDEARVRVLCATLEGKIQGYERVLARQRYLAGDEVTLADLVHLPMGARLEPSGVGYLTDEARFPNVSR